MIRNGIVLVGHPRSGSTTLRDILNLHDGVQMLNEPFNPTRGTKGWGVDYLSAFERHRSLFRSLAHIDETHRSVKHLLGQLSPELDFELFKSYGRRIFLVRRNQLKSVISTLIAVQTRLWHLRGKSRQNQPIDEISLEHVANFLNWQKSAIDSFRRSAETQDVNFFELLYEDAFSDARTSSGRYAYICSMLDFVGVSPVRRLDRLEQICRAFDHDTNKVNNARTYSLVPNIQDIEHEFASEQNGSLFEK